MSSPYLISTIVISLSALLGLGFLIRFARQRSEALGNEPNDRQEGTDRESYSGYYRPMLRMLDATELAVASEMEGVSAGDFSRFRSARLSVFRSYLKEMRGDFHRIEFKLRYVLLSASENETDLVQALNQVKSGFQLTLLKVQFQLALFALGIGSVDVQPLLGLLERLDASVMRRSANQSVAA